MLIGARQAFFDDDLSAKSYIQDGLIAMWDGIENAGWGVHNITSSKWVNLCSPTKNTFTIQSGKSSFSGNSFEVTETYGERIGTYYFSDVDWSNGCSLEVCSRIDTAQSTSGVRLITIFAADTSGFTGALCFGYDNPWNWQYDVFVRPIGSYPFRETSFLGAGVIKTFSNSTLRTVVDGTISAVNNMYRNGVRVAGGTTANNYNGAYNCALCADYLGNSSKIAGGFYNIRLYNRALTADEIAINYAIDKARFNLPT